MNAAGSAPRLLAVLDDTRGAEPALELCVALARSERRELQVIFVEHAPALAAAAWPAARVLAEAAAQWTAFDAGDVERGWRVQVQRLRRLLDRQSVGSVLEVTRGRLRETALALLGATDLLLVRPLQAGPSVPARRRLIVAVDDASAAGQQALQVAARLARAVRAQLRVLPVGPEDPVLPAADLLVLPRALLTAERFEHLRSPTLLVGTEEDLSGH